MIVSYLINTIKNIVGLKSKVYRGLIGLSRFEIIFFLLKKNLHKLLSGIVRSKRHCTKKEVFICRIFMISVQKPAASCRFLHIYWGSVKAARVVETRMRFEVLLITKKYICLVHIIDYSLVQPISSGLLDF